MDFLFIFLLLVFVELVSGQGGGGGSGQEDANDPLAATYDGYSIVESTTSIG